jgi:hypothetical protein
MGYHRLPRRTAAHGPEAPCHENARTDYSELTLKMEMQSINSLEEPVRKWGGRPKNKNNDQEAKPFLNDEL